MKKYKLLTQNGYLYLVKDNVYQDDFTVETHRTIANLVDEYPHDWAEVAEGDQLTFEELQALVIQWATDKGLIHPDNHRAQSMKVIEELGETLGAILKGKREEELDGFGDLLVTIIILAKQRDVDLVKCLEVAYGVIRDRTGKMVDGSFVKEG